MKKPSEPDESWDTLRDKIIGLGEESIRKSYYPELQQRLAELERFRALLDQSNDAIFVVQIPAGRLADANESACQQLGYRHDELLRLSIGDLIPSDIASRLNAFPQRGPLQPPAGEAIVTTLRKRTGASLPVEITARLVNFQADYFAVIVARDITERQRAEAALKASEERFRALFENSPVPIWEEDFSAVKNLFDGLKEKGIGDIHAYLEQHPDLVPHCAALVRIIDVNRAVLTMHGTTSKEELFSGLASVFTPESYATFQQELVSLWNGESEMTVDSIIQTLNGERRYVTVYWSVSPGYEDTLSKVLVSIVDITERKQTEDALRESEERFSTVFRHSPIAISIVRAMDGRFVDVNNVFINTSGYSREEIIGHTSNELNLWANPDEQAFRLQGLRQQGSIDAFEFHVRTKSGEIRTGLTATALIELGGETHYLSLIHDITDRKRAEREIIRLNRLYAVLSDINQAIVRRHDRQQLFDEACRVAVEVGQFRLAWIGRIDEQTQRLHILARYGHSEGHFEQLPVALSDHISDSGDPSATAIREGHAFVSNDIEHDGPPAPWREVAFRRGHRSLAVLPLIVSDQIWGAIHFYSAERAFFDEREMRLLEELAADLAYAVESLQRDDQRKQAEEALRQAQKMESLGVLASGVAHDFNNLLVAMLGQTSLALEQLPPGSAPRAHVEKAVGAARRAADLTRQLLAYSGRSQFQVLPINLNTLIQENLHLFEVAIPKNVRLVSDLAGSLPFIEGDIGQMQQIAMNLIINAAEAIGRNPGTVRVTTGMYYITPSDISLWKYIGSPLTPGLYATLSVQDNGSGMDATTLSKVFDPFFTTKVTGRGLGLAAVLGIVRSHKGGLRVESEPGKGTTFTLYFPVGTAQPTAPPIAGPEQGAAMTQGLVLVIDDEEPVREAVTDILVSEGLTVITASDGRAGLALYHERQADIRLVVLDLSMPGLSGEETFHELRRVNPRVAIILSSGYHQSEVTRRFAGQGPIGFLQKPYDVTALIRAVQQYLA